MIGTSLLLLAASASLTLHLGPEQNEILVGEPLRLTVTWRVARPLRLPPQVGDVVVGGASCNYVDIWVDGPGGRRQYVEVPAMQVDEVVVTTPARAGSELTSELLLFYGYSVDAPKTPGFLFSTPGTYTLMVRYPSDKDPAESNAITVRVKEPEGAERVVFDAVKSDPFGVKLGSPAMQALLKKYPGSRYLRRVKIAHYGHRESLVRAGGDPATEQILVNLSDAERTALMPQFFQQMAAELKEEGDWGVWEDVRLGLMASYGRSAGDTEGAETIEKEILARFPQSPVAHQIRSDRARALTSDEEDDDEDDDGDQPRRKPTPKTKPKQ